MELKKYSLDFSVCQIKDFNSVNLNQEFISISKTEDEISLVCETKYVPADVLTVENDWKMLKIKGVLEFGMVGVIAKISDILAAAKISIFVISTYNTDYILVKADMLEQTVQLLTGAGYIITKE